MNFFQYCPYFFSEFGEIWCSFYRESMFHVHKKRLGFVLLIFTVLESRHGDSF